MICLTVCQMKLYSFMDNGKVADATSLQSAIYLKFSRPAGKVMACILPRLHAFYKVWLKLDEHCGSSSLLNISTSKILHSAPNDPKLNSKNQT